jgi:hypothetical protein
VLVLLQTATLVFALWTSGLTRARSPTTVALVLVATVAAVLALVVQGPVLTGLVSGISGLVTAGIVYAIAQSVVTQSEVNAQSVQGAICVYLLLGMFFVFVYGVVAVASSTAFFTQGTDGTRALRVYFSYVTLATLGYGDYTPRGNFGHLLAVVEALLGQLYLVTVVAILVARLSPRRR